MISHIHRVVLAALAATAVGAASSARADTYLGYTVDGTYNGTGKVTGTFDVDSTTDTVTAVDLSVTASGGVSAFTATNATKFRYFLYSGPSFCNLATEDYDAHNLYLGFDQKGGMLASSGFGSSAVQQYFGPGYAISGAITEGAGSAGAAPEPSTWALVIAGIAIVGGTLRLGRRGAPAGAA